MNIDLLFELFLNKFGSLINMLADECDELFYIHAKLRHIDGNPAANMSNGHCFVDYLCINCGIKASNWMLTYDGAWNEESKYLIYSLRNIQLFNRTRVKYGLFAFNLLSYMAVDLTCDEFIIKGIIE